MIKRCIRDRDSSLYEAAKIEGANPFQTLVHVTLPQIKPTITSYFVFVVIATFTTFDYVWIMTQGGPAGATELLSTRTVSYTHLVGFQHIAEDLNPVEDRIGLVFIGFPADQLHGIEKKVRIDLRLQQAKDVYKRQGQHR